MNGILVDKDEFHAVVKDYDMMGGSYVTYKDSSGNKFYPGRDDFTVVKTYTVNKGSAGYAPY